MNRWERREVLTKMARPLDGYQKISEKGVATLKNTSGLILNKKYNVANLKHYFQQESDDTLSTAIHPSNFWSDTPDEIVEMILLYALQQSRNSI